MREHGIAVLRVEALERRDGHRFHHPLQRGGRGRCEMRGRRPRRVGGLRPGGAGAGGRRDPDDERPLGRAGWRRGGRRGGAAPARCRDDVLHRGGRGRAGPAGRGGAALARLRLVAVRAAPQRRALTYLDSRGERTITVLGEKLHPLGDDPLAWEELDATDGVYFTAGDEGGARPGPPSRRPGRAARGACDSSLRRCSARRARPRRA